MEEKTYIFIAGHHRSGTSLVHQIMRSHNDISGFSKSGVPQDEGQHLQTVYKAAKAYGGPGKYIFNPESYMDENHILATPSMAKKIQSEWASYYDSNCDFYVEKSPPNLIRSRFLQALFPQSKFVVILRHPLVVSYATKKWTKKIPIETLLDHTLLGYEIFMKDLVNLKSVYVLRYEDFVQNPQEEIDRIYQFIGVDTKPINKNVKQDINNKYFSKWLDERSKPENRAIYPVPNDLEKRINKWGYSLEDFSELRECSLLGEHQK